MNGLWIRVRLAVLMLVIGAALPALGQELRDPTLPPAVFRQQSASEPPADKASVLGSDGVAVVVREGRAYLVVGTRLYAPGERVDKVLVERITESQVWLREGKNRRIVPFFSGIERTPSMNAYCSALTSATPEARKPQPVTGATSPPIPSVRLAACADTTIQRSE